MARPRVTTKPLLIAVALAACGKSDSRPTFTPALMPPSAAPLVLGQSVEADVIAKFGAEMEISRDKSLGGTEQVGFNEHAAILIQRRPGTELYLWTQADATPRLGRFTIQAPEGCAWVHDHIGTLSGARNCPGNRKTGKMTDKSGTTESGYYCLAMPDGRVVHVECGGTVIEYWIGKKR